MGFSPGTRVGPFEIIASIGKGGMGEVYKARDTRLERTVAIKSSAERFSERFEREARAVAALNHPNICTLYDVGPDYLVMEYIQGQQLRGPLPLEEALRLAIQICDALDAAHRQHIVHRDLKPANILVNKSGVKLLDFGLAKMGGPPVQIGEGLETRSLTQVGSIVGTLQYMAPEQLEGGEADARSDIFSFGAILYEMVTGQRAFEGSSPASVIGAIMSGERRRLAPLPHGVDHVVEGCLAKDPNDRWQSAADIRRELEWLSKAGMPVAAPPGKPWRARIGWILAAVLLVILPLIGTRSRVGPAVPHTSFNIYPPGKTVFFGEFNGSIPSPQFALAPDAHAIAFAAAPIGGKGVLWLRRMEELEAHVLSGTEGASHPFWSPDSRWIAFFADGKLKKIPSAGGSPQVLADGVTDPRGGDWGAEDSILFAPANGTIFRVSATGGAAAPVTQLDRSHGEVAHRSPRFLPDGKHFLFAARTGQPAFRGIYVGSTDGKMKKFLVSSEWSGIYAPPGYLLYLDNGALTVRTMNAERLEITGPPRTLVDHVIGGSTGFAALSATANGMLAYSSAIGQVGRLTWFSRNGERLDPTGPEGDYLNVRLSPDNKFLASSLVDPKGGGSDLWITDLARGTTSKFTFEASLEASPVWSPDGKRIAFRTNRNGMMEFVEKDASGGGAETMVLSRETQLQYHATGNVILNDWSPDSHTLLYCAPISSNYDLWLLPALGSVQGERKPSPFAHSSAHEIQGSFSPDGRYIAYASNESGKFEVYVRPSDGSNGTSLVSTNGGYEPSWRHDMRELYYLSEDRKLMAVPIAASGRFQPGLPKPLFQTQVPVGVNPYASNYAVVRDGSRFIVNTLAGDSGPSPITVVLNWAAGLKVD